MKKLITLCAFVLATLYPLCATTPSSQPSPSATKTMVKYKLGTNKSHRGYIYLEADIYKKHIQQGDISIIYTLSEDLSNISARKWELSGKYTTSTEKPQIQGVFEGAVNARNDRIRIDGIFEARNTINDDCISVKPKDNQWTINASNIEAITILSSTYVLEAAPTADQKRVQTNITFHNDYNRIKQIDYISKLESGLIASPIFNPPIVIPDLADGSYLYTLKDQNVDIVYRNGDTFHGKLALDENILYMTNIYPHVGTYTYSSGDKWVGSLTQNVFPLPDKGIMLYVDGTREDSDRASYLWSSLTSNEKQSYLLKSVSPTEIRAIHNDRLEAQKLEKIRIAEEEAAQEKIRLEAIAAKEKAEREAKEAEERAAQEKRETYRKDLIRKYGAKWGNLVYQGELSVGMTKPMVGEFINLKAYDRNVYHNGRIEVLIYNRNNLWNELAKSESDSAIALIGLTEIIGLIEAVGLMDLYEIQQYTTLTFTNGKLSGWQK